VDLFDNSNLLKASNRPERDTNPDHLFANPGIAANLITIGPRRLVGDRSLSVSQHFVSLFLGGSILKRLLMLLWLSKHTS